MPPDRQRCHQLGGSGWGRIQNPTRVEQTVEAAPVQSIRRPLLVRFAALRVDEMPHAPKRR